jgi:hypothetical protein
MSPRDTRTGSVLEDMMKPALRKGGYDVRPQVRIGERLGTGRHKIDLLASKDGKQFLISSKWQQKSGTAEQKVPFEVICLVEARESGSYERAYLVLGGHGWKPALKELYLSGGLTRYIPKADMVTIIALEDFIAIANQGRI